MEPNINFFLNVNTHENHILSPAEISKLTSEIIYDDDEDDSFYNASENAYADIEQMELYYKTNYNVKALTNVLHYYGIYKKKMLKDEMIQVLLFFETDPTNNEIVKKRLRLWKNIKELKTDVFFGKYIMFDIY